MNEDADRADVPTDRFTVLWRRLKDHRIAQWTVGYVAVAYGIQHAVTLTSEAFKWPDGVIRISMILLALGLPVAMTLAWYHGERTARRISSGELAVVSVVLLGMSFAFYLFVRPADIAARVPAAQQASLPALPSANGVSLAVLPFVNLSGDASQEFFSDGMTEEITSALAKVPTLRMVGRTSAFQFKGQNKDLRGIGQSLGATYLIEGSVRKAGERVRVTAQLIKANDGIGLWTDNYDRDLKDIFATQEDIAQAIAGALRVPLGLQKGEALVSNRTNDLESYQQYLRARALFRARAINQAIALLEPAVARDRNYAPAWGLLAESYAFVPSYEEDLTRGTIQEARRIEQSSYDKAEMTAREAIRLDPRHASGYTALAVVQTFRNNWGAADDLFRQALMLDPDDPDALHLYGLMLAGAGHLKQAMNIREKLRTLEPFVPLYNIYYAQVLQQNGLNSATIQILEAIPPGGAVGYARNLSLAKAYAAAGRFGEAADTLLTSPAGFSHRSLEDAARLLRSASTKVKAPDALPVFDSNLSFVYAYIGAQSRILEAAERSLEIGRALVAERAIWQPLFAPVRKTERFKDFVRRTGLIDYWRARGWPNLCHPTTGNDFACE